jgi:hypothetical protein
MAKEEAEREAEFNKHLQEIEFQASRVRQIGRHARETIGDILPEKSLDLLGAMVGFFFRKSTLLSTRILRSAASL